MTDKLRRFSITSAKVFVVTFLTLAAIVTMVPACILVALATYGACVSLNWLAIFVMLALVSLMIALAVATVIHWNDRL
ncbi:MAG: hypothetical protein WAV56_04055 [Microgenomates group bacterium]